MAAFSTGGRRSTFSLAMSAIQPRSAKGPQASSNSPPLALGSKFPGSQWRRYSARRSLPVGNRIWPHRHVTASQGLRSVPILRSEFHDSDSSGGGVQSMASLTEGLSDSQYDAVHAEVGPVRVVGGPGSGKTRVLTLRIAHLVLNVHAEPWSILAVTFTKKAADKMRSRVCTTLGDEVSSRVTLGTFHSVCARLLQWYRDSLPGIVPGLCAGFSIVGSEDSRRMLAEIMKEVGDTLEARPVIVLSMISKLKNKGVRPEDMPATEPTGPTRRGVVNQHQLKQIYAVYQRRLVQSNALDFDDVILVTLQLLRRDKEVFKEVGRNYRHILVHEWQDTNGPQYDLVLQLVKAGRQAQVERAKTSRAAEAAQREAADGGGDREVREGPPVLAAEGAAAAAVPSSIFIVGDTDQCIYRFRGVDYTNVARFVQDFQECQTVLLEKNYRSTANIVRAASAVIGEVGGRDKQDAVDAKSVQGGGPPISVVACADQAGEAEAVASQMELYWTSGLVKASEMAVMYRTNGQSRFFEEACLKRGLPFVVVGGQKFYTRREVQDCVVFLRLAANPRDALALRQAISILARGTGPAIMFALERLASSARASTPAFEDVTEPECLLALLNDRDLEELEEILARSPKAGSAAHVEGSGARLAGNGAGKGTRQGYEWGGISMHRVHMLREALEGENDLMVPAKRQKNKLRVFARLLRKLGVVAATESMDVLFVTVLGETNMRKHVMEKLSETSDTDGLGRWQNVMELQGAVSTAQSDATTGESALVSFLTLASSIGDKQDAEAARKMREEQEAAAEAVAAGVSPIGGAAIKPSMIHLMTIHASKGLDFDTVFLTGLEDGIFPRDNLSGEALDEERRLMYVGMTRAKARLFLTWRAFVPEQNSNHSNNVRFPSRFIDDIPSNIVRTIDKRPPASEDKKSSGGRSGSRSQGSPPGRGGSSSGRGGRGRGGEVHDGAARWSEYGGRSKGRGSGGRGRQYSGRSGGGGGVYGGEGGGRSFESEDRRDARVFQEARDKNEAAQYPVRVVRDGGAGLARDAGEDIDTSWAAKLGDSPPLNAEAALSPDIVIGAEVFHQAHGPGKVLSLVDGSETVNVCFTNKGQAFVTRVRGVALKVRRR